MLPDKADLVSPSHRPAIFYDAAVPQLQFAAAEAGPAFLHFPIEQWTTAGRPECSPRFLVTIRPGAESPQSYSLQRAGDCYAVTAADANGALYGALDLIEAYHLGILDSLREGPRAPYLARRGIKINIPLDARTPSYSDPADAAQANIPEMWSADFWHELLDEMARHRYNVLSLWSLHPFPSMVRVPEYPDVALDDVKRTTHKFDENYSFKGIGYVTPEILERLETVRQISIDDKIRFWQHVMQYALDRGIETYLFTWNIFTYGATGKYGITDAQDNPRTVEYFRASVRETVLTYPLLAGIGITAGEQMDDKLTGEHSREAWLWRTYGEGIIDALKIQPHRKINLVHRYHQSDPPSEVMAFWKDYPGVFELSFKYSGAHMLSIVNPSFIDPVLKDLPAGKRTWLTLRNDDVYSFRWGDAAYARAYLKAIPSVDRIPGFYLGPDGDTWGREFIARTPSKPRQLVMAKHWYAFLLWGRLGYDPDLPAAFLAKKLAHRFPGVDVATLQCAWAAASQVFPLVTRFFWDVSDVRWYPEGCLSHPRHKGYYTVRHFIEGVTMPGSGVYNILEWRRRRLSGERGTGAGPLDIADRLERTGNEALSALPQLRIAGAGTELMATLGDIEAMSHLALYYAAKIRGAAALALFDRSAEPNDQAMAIAQLQSAARAWREYAKAYSAQYTSPHLYNRVGIVDIPGLALKADEDVAIARCWQPGTLPGDTPPPDPTLRLVPDFGGHSTRSPTL